MERPEVGALMASKWDTSKRTLIVGVLVLSAASVLGVALRALRDEGFSPKLGAPTEASSVDLREFATEKRPVYWIGPPRTGRRLELTRLPGRIYLRYLPPGARIGDPRAKFTAIGTYEVSEAYGRLQRDAQLGATAAARGPRGTLVVWRRSRPRNVYFARRGADYMIEVYDPSARRARRLALSGKVRPVP
jgi:hypothetical protein